ADRGVPEGNAWSRPWPCQCARRRHAGRDGEVLELNPSRQGMPAAPRIVPEVSMPLVHEIDYGTPASRSEKMVTLTIDGNEITVPEGTSIMRASMEAGIQVPKLCATDMVDAFGSCRLCLVEIEG